MKRVFLFILIAFFSTVELSAQYNNLDALAGEYEINGQKEFFYINLINNAEDAESIDLPNQCAFGIGIKDFKLDNGSISFKMKIGKKFADFLGKPTATNYQGTIKDGNNQGKFELYPIVKSSVIDYGKIAGYYRFPNKRELLFTSETYEKPYLIYMENDRVVRLYPINTHTFISSKNELFNFPKDYEFNTVINLMINGQRSQGIKVSKYVESEFTIKSDKTELKGSLLLPTSVVKNTKYPLLIFSGPTHPGNRDLMRLYADYFLEKGYACFIYDRRGFGESGGKKNFNTLVLKEDLVSITAELSKSTVIDTKKIGFVAIESGAYPALLAAENLKPFAMVMISVSLESQIETEKYNRGLLLRHNLSNKSLINKIESAWEQYYYLVVNDDNSKFNYKKYSKLLKEINNATADIPSHIKWEIPPMIKEQELSKVRGFGSFMAMNPKLSLGYISRPMFFYIPGTDPISDQKETTQILKSGDVKKLKIDKYYCGNCTDKLVKMESISGSRQTHDDYKKLSDWKISTEFFDNATNWLKKHK
jgi:hypothetical protein